MHPAGRTPPPPPFAAIPSPRSRQQYPFDDVDHHQHQQQQQQQQQQQHQHQQQQHHQHHQHQQPQHHQQHESGRLHPDDAPHLLFAPDSLDPDLAPRSDPRSLKGPAHAPPHLRTVLPIGAQLHHHQQHLFSQRHAASIHDTPAPPRPTFVATAAHAQPHLHVEPLPCQQPQPQASLRLPVPQLITNRTLYASPSPPPSQPDDHRQIAPVQPHPSHDDRIPARRLLPGHTIYGSEASAAIHQERRQHAVSAPSSSRPQQHDDQLVREHAAGSPCAPPSDNSASSAWAPLVARARQHADFWAVLRKSTLAHQWALRGSADSGEPTRGPALARGSVSMYVCDGCSGTRNVLRRHAGMLFPARGGGGVVVGHFVERVLTIGAERPRVVRGRYVLCARSRELLKLRPADDAATLAVSRAVTLGGGAILRDFVEVAVARGAAAPALPCVVAARTSVLHVGARAPADAPPFISLDLSATAAAALAIDPSAGLSGLGEHPMALLSLDPRSGSPIPYAEGSWAPPRHCVHCTRPKWVLQKLERTEAALLRGVFQTHVAVTRAPASPPLQRRLAKRPHSAPPPRLITQPASAATHTAQQLDALRPAQSAPPPRTHFAPPHATLPSTQTALAGLHVPIARISISGEEQEDGPGLQARHDRQRESARKPRLQPLHTARSMVYTTEAANDVARLRAAAGTPIHSTDEARGKPPPGTPLFGPSSAHLRARSTCTPVPLAPAGRTWPEERVQLPTACGRVRKKVDALPDPSPSDVIMRNRISAQRSNEKRRKQHNLIRMEVAYHHDTTIPQLKMRQMLLQRENEQLRSSFAAKYVGMGYCSYYGSA